MNRGLLRTFGPAFALVVPVYLAVWLLGGLVAIAALAAVSAAGVLIIALADRIAEHRRRASVATLRGRLMQSPHIDHSTHEHTADGICTLRAKQP